MKTVTELMMGCGPTRLDAAKKCGCPNVDGCLKMVDILKRLNKVYEAAQCIAHHSPVLVSHANDRDRLRDAIAAVKELEHE